MRFGVNLVNFGPGAAPDSLARWGQTAEALGYHFLMVSDHVAITPDVQARYPAPFYDPFVTLAWLAGRTSKLRLGTTVAVLPYRHPLQVASMSEGIHRLSGGRFVLGVGVGMARQEYAALGVPFGKRGAMADDYLAAIRALWDADGDVASHQGPFVSFEDVRTAPDLVGPPGSPPVWVGGSSEEALRRAVRFGDGWHPNNARLDWLEHEGLPRLRKIAREEGRPVPSFCPRVRLRLTESPLDEEQRLPGEGTLEQVRSDLETLGSLGAERVLLDTFYGDLEEARRHERAWRMLWRRWPRTSWTSRTGGCAERASDRDRVARLSKPTK
jgi:probable F420-dependent oxidoreductase